MRRIPILLLAACALLLSGPLSAAPILTTQLVDFGSILTPSQQPNHSSIVPNRGDGYVNTYGSAPNIFLQVGSDHDSHFTIARAVERQPHTFKAVLAEQKDNRPRNASVDELVHWLALPSGQYEIGGLHVEVGSFSYTFDTQVAGRNYQQVSLASSWFAGEPVVIAGLQTRAGMDPSMCSVRDISAGAFYVRVEETKYDNAPSSNNHVGETIAWIAIEPGHVAEGGLTLEAGVRSLSSGGYTALSYAEPFPGPATMVGTAYYPDTDPVNPDLKPAQPFQHLRMRNAAASGFEARVEQPTGFTSAYTGEFGYLALHENDPAPCFGRVETDHTGTRVTLGPYRGAYDGLAIGFTTMLSYNGQDNCTARNDYIQRDALLVSSEEGKNLDGTHAVETIGWLTVGPATAPADVYARDFGGLRTYYGTALQTATAGTTDDYVQITFPEAFAAVPVVVADMLTINGIDPAWVRVWDVSPTGFKMYVEESAYDPNSTDWDHAEELIAWVAMEPGQFNFPALGIHGEAGVVPLRNNRAIGKNHTGADAWNAVTYESPLMESAYSLVAQLYCTTGDIGGGDVFCDWRVRNADTEGFEFAMEQPADFDDGTFGNASHFSYIAITTPEPGTLVLLGAGVAALVRRRRRS